MGLGWRYLAADCRRSDAINREAIGPYHPSTPTHGNGQASGVSLDVALFYLDPLLNSFTWSGDAPR